MMKNLSGRQKSILSVLSIVHFCNGICSSLQAPFYPQEAAEKGCTATEFGLVLGIYELTIFLTCPLYGKYITKLGTKLLFNGGIYTTAICVILFGCLGMIQSRLPFISLSLLMRILEGAGYAGFLTASASIIVQEFRDTVSTSFAFIETCFGLGIIVGPTVGGALFQVGGYITPFAVMGSVLFLSSIFTTLVLPKSIEPEEISTRRPSIITALKIPAVLLSASSIIATSLSIGFLQATLEPHLTQFKLKPIVLGLMFIISGLAYALVAPLFGWLCDSKCKPKVIIVIGTVLVAIAFSLIGPAPFLPFNTSLTLIIVGLIFHGVGIAAQLVSTFTDALRTIIEYGFPNNLETFGLVTGLWRSSFALGAFSGPTISGFLYDIIGFRNSSLFVIVSQLAVGFTITVYLVRRRKRNAYTEIKDDDIANGDLTENIKSCFQNGFVESVKSGTSNGNLLNETNSLKNLNSYDQCLGLYSHGYGTVHYAT